MKSGKHIYNSACFIVMDETSEVADKYSISDENYLPKEILVGAKC